MVLFLAGVALFAYAQIADIGVDMSGSSLHCSHVSLGKNFNVTVMNNRGGCIVAFNQTAPYTGSVIGLAGDKSINKAGWDGWGIYFRSINRTGDKNENWWTLMVSLWYPISVFGVLSALCGVASLRGAKAR